MFVLNRHVCSQFTMSIKINIESVLFPDWLAWHANDGNKTNKHCTMSDRRLSCPEWQVTELMSRLLHNLFLSSPMEHYSNRRIWRSALKSLSIWWYAYSVHTSLVIIKLGEVLCVKLLKRLCIYKAEKNEKSSGVLLLLRKWLDFPTHEWQIKDWLRSSKNEGKGERKRAVFEVVTCDFLFLETVSYSKLGFIMMDWLE